MTVKIRESFDKTRQNKINDEYKEKYILRGERNARYYDRILSTSRERQKKFYKNSTGQFSNLLFVANPSETSWHSSPSK